MTQNQLNFIALIGTFALAAASSSPAESIYMDHTGAAPFSNNYNGGGINGYWWAGVPSDTSHVIGSTGAYGKAFVDVSWGVYPTNPTAASYNISTDGLTPGTSFSINGTLMVDQASPTAGPEWSGFGFGQIVTGLTPGANLNISNSQGISTARVSLLNGTVITADAQMADPLNAAWIGSSAALTYCATPGGSGYRWGGTTFYYKPNLTGTYKLEVSWGVAGVHSTDGNWYLDANGDGSNLQLLLGGVNMTGFSNGTVVTNYAASFAQWSGFADAGMVTLNANSRIIYENLDANPGTVCDLQFTLPPASIYIDQTGAAPFVNNYNGGGINGYWWASAPSGTSQAIGSAETSGTAWVDVSWGAHPLHPADASYDISTDGVTPGTAFTVNQQVLANGTAVAGAEWSGFGFGTLVTGFTPQATLNINGGQAITTTRVSMLTGTLIKASDQLGDAMNVGWPAGQFGACSSPGDGGYYFSNTQYFYYTPGLTGTFNFQISWGTYSSHSPNSNWLVDYDGDGWDLSQGDGYLVTNINQAAYSNGAVSTGAAGLQTSQWSGFLNLGQVTLNANSMIIFDNPSFATNAGTVSDLQLTPVSQSILPKLRMVGAGGGIATLELDAAANVAYKVEFSTTLATGSWSLLQTVPAGLERIETITDTNATDPKRFYRASVAP